VVPAHGPHSRLRAATGRARPSPQALAVLVGLLSGVLLLALRTASVDADGRTTAVELLTGGGHYFLKADLRDSRVGVRVALANNDVGGLQALAGMSNRYRNAGHAEWALLNGDLFSPSCTRGNCGQGLTVLGGATQASQYGDTWRVRGNLGFDASRHPEISVGDSQTKRQWVIGGGPRVVVNGGAPRCAPQYPVFVGNSAKTYFPDTNEYFDGDVRSWCTDTRPATLVGYTADRGHLFMGVSGGGATVTQAAQWMKDRGAYDVLRLDSGGSSGLYHNGTLAAGANSRAIANTLVLTVDGSQPPPPPQPTSPPPPPTPRPGTSSGVTLAFSPGSARVGDAVVVHTRASDTAYNTMRVLLPCGSPAQNELGAPEMSFTWSTSGCPSGTVTITAQARKSDDPTWSRAIAITQVFALSPGPPTNTPVVPPADVGSLIACNPGYVFLNCYANGEYGDGPTDAAWRGSDGDLGTRWSSLEQHNSYWQATFVRSLEVAQVSIWGRGGGDNLSGRLEFSDGSTVDVGSLNPSGCRRSVSFAPRSTTFVKFRVTGMGNRSTTGFRELQAYRAAVFPDGDDGSCADQPLAVDPGVVATATPVLPISTSSPTATATAVLPDRVNVEQAWTNDLGSDRSVVKTTFQGGDGIAYVGAVNNQTGRPVEAYFVWYAQGPSGQVATWSGNLTTDPGVTTWYLSETIPADAVAGAYTFTASVTYNGRVSQHTASFTVLESTAVPTESPSATATSAPTCPDVAAAAAGYAPTSAYPPPGAGPLRIFVPIATRGCPIGGGRVPATPTNTPAARTLLVGETWRANGLNLTLLPPRQCEPGNYIAETPGRCLAFDLVIENRTGSTLTFTAPIHYASLRWDPGETLTTYDYLVVDNLAPLESRRRAFRIPIAWDEFNRRLSDRGMSYVITLQNFHPLVPLASWRYAPGGSTSPTPTSPTPTATAAGAPLSVGQAWVGRDGLSLTLEQLFGPYGASPDAGYVGTQYLLSYQGAQPLDFEVKEGLFYLQLSNGQRYTGDPNPAAKATFSDLRSGSQVRFYIRIELPWDRYLALRRDPSIAHLTLGVSGFNPRLPEARWRLDR
jgi:hypothetical protein